MKNDNITLNNLWEHRKTIIEDWKHDGDCGEQFKRLVRARSSKTFKQVILDNFYWVNRFLNIYPKFDYACDFNIYGTALVKLNNKWGYIKSDGSYLFKPKFDCAYDFHENDITIVGLNNKWGYIKSDGSYIVEPIFDSVYGFDENNISYVHINGILKKIDIDGNYLD